MSNEISVSCSLRIAKGNLAYNSSPAQLIASLAAASPLGPTPGSLLIATSVTVVPLTGLSAQGGWAWMQNTDPTNYVTWGINTVAGFVPVGKLLPGEAITLRLSDVLLYGSSGTAHVNDLAMKAAAAPCIVRVDAFDA